MGRIWSLCTVQAPSPWKMMLAGEYSRPGMSFYDTALPMRGSGRAVS